MLTYIEFDSNSEMTIHFEDVRNNSEMTIHKERMSFEV